jgi:hypothetical protein
MDIIRSLKRKGVQVSRNDEGYTEGYGYGQGQGQGYSGGYGHGYGGGYGNYENGDGVGYDDGYGVFSFPFLYLLLLGFKIHFLNEGENFGSS